MDLRNLFSNWSDSALNTKVLSNIVDKAKCVRPRKIQQTVIPLVQAGKSYS